MNRLVMGEKEGALTFSVKVVPRAKSDGIAGIEGGALKVRVAAPPVEGRANEALVEFLAQALGMRKQQVEIVSGQRARIKRVKVTGLSEQEAKDRLGNYLAL